MSFKYLRKNRQYRNWSVVACVFTRAIFEQGSDLSGFQPVDIERFIRRQRGWVRTEVANLRTFALRPSHPIALLEGILLMRSSICTSVIGGISKD